MWTMTPPWSSSPKWPYRMPRQGPTSVATQRHDGRTGCKRYSDQEALDESGYDLTPFMSYAAKYASAFYGPFSDAANRRRNSGIAGPTDGPGDSSKRYGK